MMASGATHADDFMRTLAQNQNPKQKGEGKDGSGTYAHQRPPPRNPEREKMLARIPRATDGSEKRIDATSELICPYAFDNTLPEIPAAPKLMWHSFDVASFVRFRFDDELEAERQCRLTPEPDLGINIDLVDPGIWDSDPNIKSTPEDTALIASLSTVGPKAMDVAARTKQLRAGVTWLRKAQYKEYDISDKSAAKGRQKWSESTTIAGVVGAGPRTLAQIVEAIERSFDDAALLTTDSLKGKHPSGDVTIVPEAVLPVIPDVERWPLHFVQVNFDSDPGLQKPTDVERAYGRDILNRGILQNVPNAKNMLGYVLPARKDMDEAVTEEVENEDYEWTREYQFVVQNEEDAKDEATQQRTYFWAEEEDRIVYNEIQTRLNLKRKAFADIRDRPVSVKVVRRELNEEEISERETRMLTTRNVLRLTHVPEQSSSNVIAKTEDPPMTEGTSDDADG